MSILNWGDLTKSQEDNETIEEAIARIVAEHNDDETAHLATGQSLEAHKASDVIDHLAGSVYRDKFAFDRYQLEDYFTSIDSMLTSAGVSLIGPSLVELQTNGLLNNLQYAALVGGDFNEGATLFSNKPHWLTRVRCDDSTTQEIKICMGDGGDVFSFGFKIVNSTLSWFWYDDDETEHTDTIDGINIEQWHTYEMIVTEDLEIKFYIDKVLIHTTEANAITYNFSAFVFYSIKATSAVVRDMHVSYFLYDCDYFS